MDIFLCLMCLNNCIDMSNMRLLASGAITYVVLRNWISISFSNIVILITILGYLVTEIDYKPFQIFLECCLKIKYKNLQSILPKLEAWRQYLSLWPCRQGFTRLQGAGGGRSKYYMITGGRGGMKRAKKGLYNLWIAPKSHPPHWKNSRKICFIIRVLFLRNEIFY